MKYDNHFSKVVGEKIAYNQTLNPDFWHNGKFDQAVRTKLLQIANDFYSDLKVDAPIIDIHLTGSMASYSWTELSDLDVHVHIDFSLIDENTDLVKQALEGQKFVWKLRHPVSIKGHDVEMYVQDNKTHTVSSGIYSLLKDEWLTEPKYDPPKIDAYAIAEKVEEYKTEIDELCRLLSKNAEEDARLIFDRAKVLKKKISGARDEALKRSGEFSSENLIFKELRSQGYIGRLIKLQAKAYSAIYSDEDYVPDETKIMQEKEKSLPESLASNKKINGMQQRIVESFSQYVKRTTPILENIAAAKVYMKKRVAELLRKDVKELTPDEEASALNNRDYQQILRMLNDQPGYVMAFVKFHFDQGIDLSQLTELADTFRKKRHVVSQLPNSVDEFAAMPTGEDRVTGFERLQDAIRTIERNKEAKWFIDRLPRPLREQYRTLPKEQQTILLNAAHTLTKLGKDITERLMQKIKAMGSWAIADVIDYVGNFLKGYSNADMQQKVDAIVALEPEAGLLYLDDRYLALSARTEQSQKDLCSVANWCINRGSFKSYADDAVQINIFDFGKPATDPMYLTGTTIYYTGTVRTAHDINDTHIYTTSDPTEHFRHLGYPEKMVTDLIKQLPVEIAVKKIIYDLKVNQLKPIVVLFNVIKQSYLIDPETDDEALQIAKQILIDRISQIASRKEISDMYERYGVLSKFSADLLGDLLPDITPEELEKIKNRTITLFSMINRAASSSDAAITKSPQLKIILAQQKNILSRLGVEQNDANQVVESLEEMVATMAASPTTTPTKTPTKTPTRPMTPNRPSPIPTKRPFKTPEPTKATEEDVLKRLKSILNGTNI